MPDSFFAIIELFKSFDGYPPELISASNKTTINFALFLQKKKPDPGERETGRDMPNRGWVPWRPGD